jgi:Phosphodiester glycosidase
MLRRAAIVLAAAATLAPAARAGTVELFPGVTHDHAVSYTPHGAVVLDVVTAPRPGEGNGLYQLAPVLAHGTISGGTERVSQLERELPTASATVGVGGDLFSAVDGHPSGIVLSGGTLAHPPLAGRSSIGVGEDGALHVDRVRFVGTWQGRGQRRPLASVNDVPAPGQVVLFTSAYGPRTPAVPGAAEAIFASFPGATPNAALTATVAATGSGGGEAIPPGGAVLMARGAAAAKLAAEAPAGTLVRSRLILQPSWAGVASALGGGPLLVRGGKAVFRSLEDFTNDQLTARTARAAVGQLADGRILLVTVDGGRPGYSVGLTSFELGQALVRLGAVTAAGLAPGDAVTLASGGRVLNRPSGAAELPVKDALLVEYFGVVAPDPPVPLLNGDPGRTGEPLAYTVVRPSAVTAQLVGPDGVARALETGAHHEPGTVTVSQTAFDAEGTWHWNVTAVDDLGRSSSVDRTFRYDTTLRGLVVPRVARGGETVSFTLTRPARVTLRIESRGGVLVRELAPLDLGAGAATARWDGRLPLGSRAYGGAYVAHLLVTSDVGSSELSAPFRYRR